jgi:hypothetical protein
MLDATKSLFDGYIATPMCVKQSQLLSASTLVFGRVPYVRSLTIAGARY